MRLVDRRALVSHSDALAKVLAEVRMVAHTYRLTERGAALRDRSTRAVTPTRHDVDHSFRSSIANGIPEFL
jgi:hypothetical protein